MIQILSHRGLDPDKENYFMESSLEAFTDQLKRGFGLEFDIRITKDKKIVVFHDKDLSRIDVENVDKKIEDLFEQEIITKKYNGCHIASLSTLLQLIKNSNALCALHFKGELQTQANIDLLLKYFDDFNINNLIIFDVKRDTSLYIKSKIDNIKLAPSVAHPYDIERFNGFVDKTLISIDEAIRDKDIYDWVWLDEWDRSDYNLGEKLLYKDENIKKLRDAGFKIAIVSPELHGTSPKLLGGEKHQDAEDTVKLEKRIKEIISLFPDVICTDYPDRNKLIMQNIH